MLIVAFAYIFTHTSSDLPNTDFGRWFITFTEEYGVRALAFQIVTSNDTFYVAAHRLPLFQPRMRRTRKKEVQVRNREIVTMNTETERQRRKIYGMRFNVMQSYQYCKHLVFASLLKWTTTLCTFEYINNITCVRLSLSFSACSVCVCSERDFVILFCWHSMFFSLFFFDMNANFGPWHEFNIYVHCKQNKHIERRCIAITSLIFFFVLYLFNFKT